MTTKKLNLKKQVILQVWPSYVAGPSEDIRDDVVGYRIEIFKKNREIIQLLEFSDS